MPSSPLQFVYAQTQPHPPIANSLLGRCRKRRRPIGAALGQQCPGDARHLVGKRHRDHLERFAGEKLCEPGIRLWLTQLLARRPFKVVAVALANKMARIAWALLAKGGTYRAPQLVAA